MGSITELVIKARDPSYDPYRPAGVPDSFAKPQAFSAGKLSAPPVNDMAAAPSVQRPQQINADPTPAPATPPAGPGLRTPQSPPRQHPWIPNDYQPPRQRFPSSQVPVPQSVINGASRAMDWVGDRINDAREAVEDFGDRIGRSRPAAPSTASAPARSSSPGLNVRGAVSNATRQANDLLGGPAIKDKQGNQIRGQMSSDAPLAPGSQRGPSVRTPIPPAPQQLAPQDLDSIIDGMAPAAPVVPPGNYEPQNDQYYDPTSIQGYDQGIPDGYVDQGYTRTADGWRQPR